MPRLIHAGLIAAAAVVLLTCAHPSRTSDTEQTRHPRERMDDQYEVPPPRDTVPKVMQAKLAHAQAILEGLALADYSQIEVNASTLKSISREAQWLAHDSVEYFELSADFREVCDNLVLHARARNMQATVDDYAALTNSCVACHDYLRRRRQTKDMPGRVSMDGPQGRSPSNPSRVE
jgi:hypothetical protein